MNKSIFFCVVMTHMLSAQEQSLFFIRQFVKPGNLVFDVGANKGEKTDLYCNCGARVVCFEPQQACISILREKFKHNSHVKIEQVGLADKDGFLKFMQCTGSNTISTFSSDWVEKGRFAHNYTWDKTYLVPVKTLDQMIAKYGVPHFCKIDVEGFEYTVLKGLSTPIPYISFEYCEEFFDATVKCVMHLKSLGYKNFNFSIAETDQLVFSWLAPEVFLENLKKLVQEKKYTQLWGDVYAWHE